MRKIAEVMRKIAEVMRRIAEVMRRIAEFMRKVAEVMRKIAEVVRRIAEVMRKIAEVKCKVAKVMYFLKCIFLKCFYPKCIFAKCTRLACLLSFASLFIPRQFLENWNQPEKCPPILHSSAPPCAVSLSWTAGDATKSSHSFSSVFRFLESLFTKLKSWFS